MWNLRGAVQCKVGITSTLHRSPGPAAGRFEADPKCESGEEKERAVSAGAGKYRHVKVKDQTSKLAVRPEAHVEEVGGHEGFHYY